MTTVRDLFLEALAMKVQEVPWPEIRERLITKGHKIGYQVAEVGGGSNYQFTFGTGEKISFDGTDYHFVR